MEKNSLDKKKSKTTIACLFVIAILSIALVYAAVLYTLTIPNTMRLKTTYGLELRTGMDVLITSYDWSEFNDGELKTMAQDHGTYVRLKNVGNSVVNVVWSAVVPEQWTLVVRETGTPWNSGTKKQIAIGGELSLIIQLTEVSAVAGVGYNFDLKFDITD